MLDGFMNQFMKEIELEGSLATEVPGVYAIPVDDAHSIFISSIPRGIALSCEVCSCPKGGEETLYTQLLLANLFGKGTDGCILGLDADGERLTLRREIDYNIDYKEFSEIVEDFLNSVDFWHQEAQAYGTGGKTKTA